MTCAKSPATPTPLRLAALAVALAAFTSPALAQDGNPRDDRFTLRLSAFNPGADLRLGLEGEATDGTETATISDAASLDTGDDWRPRGSFGVRIGDRHSVGASYYDYKNDESWSFGGGMADPGVPGGPLELPAVEASGDLSFEMISAHYEYAVIATPAFEWGLGLGATHVDLETVADIAWEATDEVDAGTATARDRIEGWSPAVHTRLTWRPSDRWRLDFEGQYLDANWGDFVDEDGHFERAGLVLEYLVNDRVGVHVGYDWFRLKLRDTFAGTLDPPADSGLDPVDYAGTGRSQLKVHGPMAGVTFRF